MAAQQKKKKNDLSGLVLLAKKSGSTSFSSLWDIKHALGTDKVGHTGTLDSFAEGLLVVLTGNLTHLVPHITGFTKTYEAVVCFGKETDTLDPCGKIIKTGAAPSKEALQEILPKFTGALLQVPPVYSAVHVDGHRASDMARRAEKKDVAPEIQIDPREIFIYKNELKDFLPATESDTCSYALLEIVCSKGTYIRSLARDIGAALGTCGHLSALRRTTVGPFLLSDAVGYEFLEPFTIAAGIETEKRCAVIRSMQEKIALEKDSLPKAKNIHPQEKKYTPEQEKLFAEIQHSFSPMTMPLAEKCGFLCATLKHDAVAKYLNGRPLETKMWTLHKEQEQQTAGNAAFAVNQTALFYEDGQFAGIIEKEDHRFSYGFVVHPQQLERTFSVYSWNDILTGKFPEQYRKTGTAISVGSFDGIHAGHQKLLELLLSQKNLVPGIVTFRASYKTAGTLLPEKKSLAESGEVSTLDQRIELFRQSGMAFVVVIDFSADFARIEGTDFFSQLIQWCGMKYLAEGSDFRCGYKGSCTTADITRMAADRLFTFAVAEEVTVQGERVSSSRIRKAVGDGDFSLAQKMLLRPYSYDCASLVWKKEAAVGDSYVYTSAANFVQVLPPDGTFNVVAIMSGSEDNQLDCTSKEQNPQTFHTYKTVCTLECGNLRLLLPSDKASLRVRALNFIPVNNGYPEK